MPSGTAIRISRPHQFGALGLWLLFTLLPGSTAAETVIVHGGGSSYRAEEPHSVDAETMIQYFSAEGLRDLAAPIALYPDDLLALVLPAATHPLQIVEAAGFLADLESNPDQVPDEAWDPTVVALLNYPEVLQLLNADLSWTRDLGQATLNQEAELIAAIETFRQEAYAAGNLSSDHRMLVEENDGALEIRPAHPQVIYVPYYDTNQVLRRQSAVVYHYYPRPYPVYYYPYAADHWFTSGWFWGVRHNYRIGWQDRRVYLNRPYAERRYHRGYGNYHYRGYRNSRFHGGYHRRYRADAARAGARSRRHKDRHNRSYSFATGRHEPRGQRNPGARHAEPRRSETRQAERRRSAPRRADSGHHQARRSETQRPGIQRPTGQSTIAPRPGIQIGNRSRQQTQASSTRSSTTTQAATRRYGAPPRADASADASAPASARARPATSSMRARPGIPAGKNAPGARPGIRAGRPSGSSRGSQFRR